METVITWLASTVSKVENPIPVALIFTAFAALIADLHRKINTLSKVSLEREAKIITEFEFKIKETENKITLLCDKIDTTKAVVIATNSKVEMIDKTLNKMLDKMLN